MNNNFIPYDFNDVDPARLAQAKKWYETFTGTYAMKTIEDRELVELFDKLKE